MAQSSPLVSAAGMAASWLFAGLCLYVSVVHFDEVRGVGRTLLGIAVPDNDTAQPAKPIETARGERESEAQQSSSSSSGSGVRLKADRLGHFITNAEVNGRSVEVLVDTGASIVAFTYEDAERAGIYVSPSDFTHRVNTANGQAKVAPVMVDQIAIGDITVRNVKAAVSEPGKLHQTLLGMTFLGRLSRAEMRRGELFLEE